MASMCSANRRDALRMARGRKPVVHGRTDLAALNWRLAQTMVSGDEQDDPVAASDRRLEATVDCPPRLVQVHAVKIEGSVRIHRTRGEAAVPASVQR